MNPAGRTVIALTLLASAAAASAELTVQEVLARHVEARGGAAAWREARTLWAKGIYATFSDRESFEIARRSDDVYRLDFRVLGGAAVRARDEHGPWWLHPLLQPQAARLEEGPYKGMIERESLFGPLLVDAERKGLEVELVGPGDVDGIDVVELRVVLPGGAEERWYLDAESFLEVAVDSQVHDFTQSPQPMRQRAFFDDFREVDGLVIPFRVDYEFGHRLESMTIEEASVNREIADELFSPPPPPSEPAEAEAE